MAKPIITQQFIKHILNYNPLTGVFIWKIERPGKARKGNVAGYSRKYKSSIDYRFIGINGIQYREHRLAWLYVFGRFPKGQIDHKDGNSINNRINNLREVTNQDNCKNQSRPVNNTSGCIGVSWRKTDKVWASYIYIDYVRKHLGNFKVKNDAIICRKMAEFDYGFHEHHDR